MITQAKLTKRPGVECWDVAVADEWLGTVEHTAHKHWTPKDTDGKCCARFMCTSKREAITQLRMSTGNVN